MKLETAKSVSSQLRDRAFAPPLRLGRRYLLCFFGMTAICLLVQGGFNWLIDPFWIHRGPWSSYWLPTVKQLSSRVAKAEVAARDEIDIALIGDSRVLFGIDPAHEELRRIGRAYNLGMLATTVEEATRTIELLVHENSHSPRRILWVMQPEFLVYDRRPQRNADFRLSRLNPEGDALSRWRHSVWSHEATWKSIRYLRDRRKAVAPIVAGREAVPYQEAIVNLAEFRREGQALRTSYLQQSHVPPGVEMEAPVGRVFQACAARGIRIDVIVPPSHAVYWECLHDLGWSERVELGKQTLVRLAEAALPAKHEPAGREPLVRIWDFSGFDGPAAEAIPEENSPIHWHTDPVHFSTALGDRIIRRVLGAAQEPEFGRQLTSENLDEHLAGWREGLRDYIVREAPRWRIAQETPPALR